MLGIGGMGEVYRARDLRLQRDIALKTLPDAAASDPERRERFRREALAVAAFNHPHIVTIHSVEDADSVVFLTMELVEGRSLAEALPPGGLSLERVLEDRDSGRRGDGGRPSERHHASRSQARQHHAR